MLSCSFLRKIGLLIAVVFLLCPPIVSALVPNDPLYRQWGYDLVKVEEAWKYTVGQKNIIVAVIDNGFDEYHPDLAPNVWKNPREIPDNGIDDDLNGYVDDITGWNFVAEDFNGDGVIDEVEKYGNNRPTPSFTGPISSEEYRGSFHHGTIVAGLIGAVGNNGLLGSGINWQVSLMNLKIIGNSGESPKVRLVDAIYYAVDNGADVINFSVVTPNYDDEIGRALAFAVEKGVVLVAAAGNDFADLSLRPFFPICTDNIVKEAPVIGVSAVREGRFFSGFSNIGGNCIDITAPGVDVSSTMRFDPQNGLEKQFGGGWKGTSFAAPFLSGTAALIKSLRPDWGAKEVSEAIYKTVSKTKPDNEDEYFRTFGRGLVQIGPAVSVAATTLYRGYDFLRPSFFSEDGRLFDLPADLKGVPQENIISDGISVSGFEVIKLADSFGFVSAKRSAVDQRKIDFVFLGENKAYLHSFSLPMRENSRFIFGDFVSGNLGFELAVFPNISNGTLVEFYNLNGVLLGEVNLPNEFFRQSSASIGFDGMLYILAENTLGQQKIFSIDDGIVVQNYFLQTELDLRRESVFLPIGKKYEPHIVAFAKNSTGLLVYINTTNGKTRSSFQIFEESGSIPLEKLPIISSWYDPELGRFVLFTFSPMSGLVRLYNGFFRLYETEWPTRSGRIIFSNFNIQ